MSAAVTELSAARASRPWPDPLFWPAGESARGRPLLATPVPAGAAAPADDAIERHDRPEAGAAFELWGVVRWAVHRLWPAREE